MLVPLHRWWAAQVLLVPLLLIAPGSILLQALRIPSRVVRSFPVYVPCASIIVLFGSGLAVNLLGPLIGVAEPLRAVPLLVGFEVICLGLVVACVSAPADVTIEWRSPRRPVRVALPLVLPLAAAVGALRLNNSHSNAVAVAPSRSSWSWSSWPRRCPPGWTKRCWRWCCTRGPGHDLGVLAARRPALRLRHRRRIPAPAAHGLERGVARRASGRRVRRHAQCHRHASRTARTVRDTGAADLQGCLPDDLRAVPGGDLRSGPQDPGPAVGLHRGRVHHRAVRVHRARHSGPAGDRPGAVRRADRGHAGQPGPARAAVAAGRPARRGAGPVALRHHVPSHHARWACCCPCSSGCPGSAGCPG